MANSADPNLMQQNAASDQGLHCLFNLQVVKGSIKSSKFQFKTHSETVNPASTMSVVNTPFLNLGSHCKLSVHDCHTNQ